MAAELALVVMCTGTPHELGDTDDRLVAPEEAVRGAPNNTWGRARGPEGFDANRKATPAARFIG